MAAAGPAVDPTRGTKSSKAIRVDITLNTRVNARSKRKESFTQPQVLSGVAPGCALCNTDLGRVSSSHFYVTCVGTMSCFGPPRTRLPDAVSADLERIVERVAEFYRGPTKCLLISDQGELQ